MIHILPDDVIDRIAAGEVVERPYSVVKELMENSIDAGATSIEITLEAGGKKLIKVVDDGDGMTPADLQAVFRRHATSKLDRVDDLLHIASLGFRGEALASIGSVARTRITSRPRTQSEGACIENSGGTVTAVRPAASQPGTKVEVHELFSHVPARLKFLKADSTELSHTVEAVTRILLAFPGVAVRLLHNGRSVLECEKNLSLHDRIRKCFNRELSDNLLPVDGHAGRLRMSGFVGRPEIGRRDRKRSYLFINGRYVNDKVVHAAVRRSFRERLPSRLQPVYFLNLSVPHEEVDVNVHPMKLEVRFRDGTSIFAGTLGIVENALAVREQGASGTPWVVRDAPRFTDRTSPFFGGRTSPSFGSGGAALSGTGKLVFGLGESETNSAQAEGRRINLRAAERFLQVHDNYLLFEVDEGVAIVDQHALHERVLYHRLKEEYESGGILLQNLLVPATVEVDKQTALRFDELRVELRPLGIETEAFGWNSLKIMAIPLLFKKADPAALAREVIERLIAGDRGEEAYLDLLHTMACKAAVRAGDRLEEDELAELIGFMDKVEDASHCPHGRPTTILLTRGELEEMFKRRGF